MISAVERLGSAMMRLVSRRNAGSLELWYPNAAPYPNAGSVVLRMIKSGFAVCGAAVIALSIFLSFASAQVLEPVDLDAAEQNGYGRMVLTFKDRTLLPVYDAVVTGGVLRVSFEEPIDINVDDVPLALSDYITIARRDPDGAAIRFAMKRQFRINTLEAGEKLFIDILPLDWQGLPPGLPDDVVRELAKRAEAALRKVRALEQARLKAQEGPRVDLHIGDHPTFTRLVFDWSIKFDTAFVRENDIVKVTFNHPAQLDISRLRAQLPPGVIDATSFLDQGKLKFLMRIEPSVDIRAFREDQTYVIDITPENFLPNDRANALIDRELSIEQSDSHTQMVVAPGLRDTRDAGQGKAASGSSASMAAPNALEESRADESEAYTVVPIGSLSDLAPQGAMAPSSAIGPPERQMAGFAADGVANETLPLVGAVEPVETLPAPETRLVVAADNQVEDGSEVTASIGTVQTGEDSRELNAGNIILAQNVSSPEGPAAPESGKVTDPDAEQNRTNGIPDLLPAGPRAGTASAGAPGSDNGALEEVAEGIAPEGPTVPTAIELPAPDGSDLEAFADFAAAPSRPSPERPPEGVHEGIRNFVAAEARRIGKTVRIVFPFSEPVSSAVFRRNNSIWMVFDTDATIDTRGILSALGKSAQKVEMEQYEDHQAVRIDLSEPALATISTDGDTWSLVIGDMILEPSFPLHVERAVRADGGSIMRIPFRAPQNIWTFTDPFVGDTIHVVTGFGPTRGVLKPQTFVNLDALSSVQGIAIVPKSDTVTVRTLGDDVIIEKEGGLALSNKYLRGGTGTFNSVIDPNEAGYVEFVSLTTGDPANYRIRLQELQSALSHAGEGQRRKELMDLARFYLAHQFAQEALGLMTLALEEDPALAEDTSFNLMMGAAEALGNRPEDAFAHLSRPDLKNNPDAAVWQTVVDVQLGNWTAARIAMPRGRAVIGNYPRAIQVEFKLAAAQAMVEVNDFGLANSILAEIEPSEVSQSQAARYDILRGRVADASGRSKEALAVFDLVSRSNDRPRAAEAEYRAMRIRHRDGDTDIDTTVERLAGLSTAWRGDEIELKTLRFLAQLQAERGSYREAFEAMKAAVQAEPEAATTRRLQEEMNDLFVSLYLDGRADKMSPIKALALFYDFRELTPIGRQGDEIVRMLAKRLVEIDLLDQATELLQHQVDNRLKGAARAQIAADLAAIYLTDRKPEAALKVLTRTRQASLPATLERQRNIVEARALTASGRPDLALELVRNMRGADVDRLRADTFWAAESWREAGEQMEAMHGSRWSDNIPLDDLERRDILKAGIAFSLSGDQLSLDRLKTKYKVKMSESPEAFAFEVVTRPIESQGVEFLALANRLANTDTLDTFMEEYRRQYMSPGQVGDEDRSAAAGAIPAEAG